MATQGEQPTQNDCGKKEDITKGHDRRTVIRRPRTGNLKLASLLKKKPRWIGINATAVVMLSPIIQK